MENALLVECKPDYLFASLIVSIYELRLHVRHFGGKGKVVNKLHRSCRDSIAIIDQDPGSAQP